MASGLIISWQIDGEKVETVKDIIFLGSEIIVDSVCNHKIKRCLLLERKAMTNLDSILKSKDITLPTKVCIFKAIIFPVLTFRCKSWTVKKAEQNGCFCTVVVEKTCENPLDSKEIKPVNLKENQPWIFIGSTDAEAEAPVLWPPNARSQLIGKYPHAGEDWRQKEKKVTRWFSPIFILPPPQKKGDSMDMNLGKLGDGKGQGILVCCSPWGHEKSDTTWWLNNNNKNDFKFLMMLTNSLWSVFSTRYLYLLYALLVDLSKSFSIFLKVKITHLTPSLPMFMCVLSCFSGVWLFVTLWTIVCQPGSYVQARILEWVAMPSSRESSQPRGQTCISWVFCIGRWVPYQ